MKRFQLAIALLLVVGAPCTYAEGIPTIVSQESAVIEAQGDFLTGQLIGPGVNLNIEGFVECTGCRHESTSGPPGSSFYADYVLGTPDVVLGSLTLGGQTINCSGSCPISLSDETGITSFEPFTLPPVTPGGGNFDVTVPAVDGPFAGTVKLPGGATIPFNLQIPPGELQLQWHVDSMGGGPSLIYFWALGQATFTTPTVATPEPGGLGLMAAGLAGLLGRVLKRRSHGAAR